MGNKLILVTGATGFVGKHLVRNLLANNFDVAILVRKTSNIKYYKDSNIKIFYIENGIKNIFETNIDGIIHIATSYGQKGVISDIYQTNVVLPLQLLEFGVDNDINFFINTDTFFTKSTSVYDYLNNYTKSKTLIAELINLFSSKTKIINFKLEHVFGEGDSENKFIVQIINRLKNNETFIDLTDGSQRRDFIYIDDVANAYIKVLENLNILSEYTEIEVGTGYSLSIREVVEIIKECTQSSSKLNFGALPKRKGEFIESIADIKALKDLGWTSKYDFRTGIKKILEQEN
jgi:nucleoside-diphosphate-sugar epimerase